MSTAILTTASVSLLLSISVIEGWRPYYVNFRNLSYVVMRPEIVDFEITNRTYDNIQYFSGYANILRDVYEAFVHFTVLFESSNENFDSTYINSTYNVCELLGNVKLNIFAVMMFKILSEYVEIPKRCPMLKKYYKIDNGTFNVEVLPPMMPDKKLLFHLSGWMVQDGRKIMIGKGSVIASIERTYRKNV